jgi:hypothetical protein
MLVSLMASAAEMPGNWQPFSTGEAPAGAARSYLRPEDPTTLTLALIGVVMMAVYLAVRRSARDRGAAVVETVQSAKQVIEVGVGAEVAETTVDQPSRGAA